KLPKPSTRSPGFTSGPAAADSESAGLLARSESGVAPGYDRGGWGALGSLAIGLFAIWVIFHRFFPRGRGPSLLEFAILVKQCVLRLTAAKHVAETKLPSI